MTSDTSQLLLTATLQDYSHPHLQAHYDAMLDAGQFRKILANPSLPVGFIRASGTVDYQEIANRSLLDTVVVKGDLNSHQLDVQTPAVRSQIRDIAAHYTLENGDATLPDFRANLLGGVLTGTGKMSNHRRQPALQVQCLFARHPAGGSEPRHEIFGCAKEHCLGRRVECGR